MIWWRSYSAASCGPKGSTGNYNGFGWSTFLLPYLEQQNLYDKFDFGAGIFTSPTAAQNNYKLGATRISAFLCPSDPQGGELTWYTGTATNGTDIREDLQRRLDMRHPLAEANQSCRRCDGRATRLHHL